MNSWKIIGQTCIIVWLISCCTGAEKPQDQAIHSGHAEIPQEVKQAIEREFPGAIPYSVAIDTLLQHLFRVGITTEQILWGQSTCVDDITNTKDKSVHPEIKGPFTFGGLGGIPFTGVTGLDAFAHHVPDDGTAIAICRTSYWIPRPAKDGAKSSGTDSITPVVVAERCMLHSVSSRKTK